MKKPILMLIVLMFLWNCEDNKGQYRHDLDHHEDSQQNMTDETQDD